MDMKFFFIVFINLFFSFPSHAITDKIYKELETFARIIEILDENYVEGIDEHQLIDGAIKGMLSSLDPHTVYLSPEMYHDFKSDTTGVFGGIGIEITIQDGFLTIVSPLEDTPAFQAGLKAGDRILKVNGDLTKGMTLLDAVHKMRGLKGKLVVITIWREGLKEPRDFTIARDIIKTKSIKSELLSDGYAYAQIISFQENTAVDLEAALKDLEKKSAQPLKGLLLDLRNNPGGLLSEAILVSDLFMSKGIIVSTKGYHKKGQVKKAKKGDPFEDIDLVVLINRGSASASEIVAGALQDTNRARILGTTSFGKGSVQTIIDMNNNSALKVTVAHYYTPKGKNIDGKGIVPDIVLGSEELNKDYPTSSNRPELRDYQKKKGIEFLKGN